jgi:hypothetical protein
MLSDDDTILLMSENAGREILAVGCWGGEVVLYATNYRAAYTVAL